MKHLICGLGNIGDDYADTRHNIGFIILDALAADLKASFSTGRYAQVAECRLKSKSLVLIKPSTYMNLSGKAVRYWMNMEKIPLENCLVVTDDLSLPLGSLRMRQKGSDAGHNGLISIIENLNSQDFPRLRFGIGNDFPKGSQVDYVLGRWTLKEREIILPRIDLAVKMIKSFAVAGIARTMNDFNSAGI